MFQFVSFTEYLYDKNVEIVGWIKCVELVDSGQGYFIVITLS